ncbi:MAG: hypothetical protein WC635_05630 [Bacteriovorax sp.]|jgi:hypothetical protein
MRSAFLLIQITFLCFLTIGAKTHIARSPAVEIDDIKFLELKLKNEISDKKLTNLKKYALAILAARELRQLNYKKESDKFYLLAKDINVDENKNEITLALASNKYPQHSIYFFDVNLKALIKNKSYEKAILSINPEKLNEPEFARYRIIYDLLNVKIKKRLVKNLYCFQDYQKDPESYYQYSTLLCDLMINYLRNGKLHNDHIKVVEEYFFKHDLKERYLLQLAKDLKPAS